MKYNPEKHHRRSIRLKDYDYSQEGAYFVTICTYNRNRLFGEIINGDIQLNDAGKIANQFWLEVGVQNFEPLRQNRYQRTIPKSIGSIIRGFKIGVTKWFRQNTSIYNVWQRNYYEHIIRNENELNRVGVQNFEPLCNGKSTK